MRFFTTVYVLLLAYIIAALLFWGISLQKQSKQVYEQEYNNLKDRVDSLQKPSLFNAELNKLALRRDTRTKQYLGEGATFLIIILIGAGVVYTSFRRSVRLSRQQNNFMLAVTHELKSPIAGIKLSLQTLQKHKLTETQQQTFLSRCIDESDRLNDLCNNMLLTSQMEGGKYKTAKEIFSFTEMVDDSIRAYSARYPNRFVFDIDEEAMVNGDLMLLQMAVHNLLENAVKYTPADTEIRVLISKENQMMRLQVADRGAGIPEEEKKKIFSKFYRIGDETTRKTKGTGLGLYLTSRIIRQHKGRLTVKNNAPTGSVFEICLPAA